MAILGQELANEITLRPSFCATQCSNKGWPNILQRSTLPRHDCAFDPKACKMLTKRGYLRLRQEPASTYSNELEQSGFTRVSGAFTAAEIAELHEAATAIYDVYEADPRNTNLPPDELADFRYAMFNRSVLIQNTIGHRAILDVIEPLLGEDCHIIANTCWRNPPREKSEQGGGWHIDAGPHVPHDPIIRWDDRIPYPVFAIGVHLYLQDCPIEAGPTGVIPGSHKCGAPPPPDARDRTDLACYGEGSRPLVAKAGDLGMFVSDIWHRRLPTGPGDPGRFFIQAHYGRRDIAQRVRPTKAVNHVSDQALEHATTDRQRTLIGLHPRGFYDG
jgi:hypothetical protein